MTLGAPKSENRADPNYVASFELALRPHAHDQFWLAIAQLPASLGSAPKLALMRGRIGVLAHIPHSWAAVFAAGAAEPAPYFCSVHLSKLEGTALPKGAIDAVRKQCASSFGPAPLAENVLSHEGGMRAATV